MIRVLEYIGGGDKRGLKKQLASVAIGMVGVTAAVGVATRIIGGGN